MRSLVFWGALPFVFPQAMRLRTRVPRFLTPRGSAEGTVGNGRALRLVGVGDSIIAGVGASDHSTGLVGETAKTISRDLGCSVDWYSRGSVAANSKKVLNTLAEKLPHVHADAFVVSVGVNDISSLERRKTYRHNLQSMIELLSHHSPECVIAFAGMPPLRAFPLLPQPLRSVIATRGHSFDAVLRYVTERYEKATYVPIEVEPSPAKFNADGLHPSYESYREYGDVLGSALAERLRSRVFSSPPAPAASAFALD